MELKNIKDIRSSIIQYKNDPATQNLEARYRSKSMLEVLGVSRKELAHSNFIAWLLNPLELGELATYNLKKFIEILAQYNNTDNKSYETLFDEVITDNATFSNIKTFIEKSIGKHGRVDIVIKFKCLYAESNHDVNIIIENKVTSKENNRAVRSL